MQPARVSQVFLTQALPFAASANGCTKFLPTSYHLSILKGVMTLGLQTIGSSTFAE